MATALTVTELYDHSRAFIKAPSGYWVATTQVEHANTVNSIISGFHRWHWNVVAGTNIALSSGVQEANMASADQNMVLAIQSANVDDASVSYPDLWVWSEAVVPRTGTTGRPYAVSLISPARLRFYPSPDGTYTFVWRYHRRPVIIAAATENLDIPEAFTDVAKAGYVWQLLSYADDSRAPEWEKTFYGLLENHRRIEKMTMGRNR